MEAVILVAGCSRRMQTENFKGHKALLDVGNYSFLGRLLHQCLEYNISKITLVVGCKAESIREHVLNLGIKVEIIENPDFENDTNIKSMQLALSKVTGRSNLLILEGDVYITDYGFKKISESFKEGSSTWITKGDFNKDQYGGVLLEKNNIVKDILIVEDYSEKLKKYKKLTGIMTISKDQIPVFSKFIDDYISDKINCYYLQPWIDHLDKLECKNLDLNSEEISSCNTYDEYEELIKTLEGSEVNVCLEEVSKLIPIEETIKERENYLFKKISMERVWVNPVVVSIENNFILDGHHRFRVAKMLNLKKIPVVKLNYSKVKIWSLRQEFECNQKAVTQYVKSGKLYPNKTVKHDFKIKIPKCNFLIDQLS